MIQNLNRQEIYEIFNIKEPNCMQYDVVDYIMELQNNIDILKKTTEKENKNG